MVVRDNQGLLTSCVGLVERHDCREAVNAGNQHTARMLAV